MIILLGLDSLFDGNDAEDDIEPRVKHILFPDIIKVVNLKTYLVNYRP